MRRNAAFASGFHALPLGEASVASGSGRSWLDSSPPRRRYANRAHLLKSGLRPIVDRASNCWLKDLRRRKADRSSIARSYPLPASFLSSLCPSYESCPAARQLPTDQSIASMPLHPGQGAVCLKLQASASKSQHLRILLLPTLS